MKRLEEVTTSYLLDRWVPTYVIECNVAEAIEFVDGPISGLDSLLDGSIADASTAVRRGDIEVAYVVVKVTR